MMKLSDDLHMYPHGSDVIVHGNTSPHIDTLKRLGGRHVRDPPGQAKEGWVFPASARKRIISEFQYVEDEQTVEEEIRDEEIRDEEIREEQIRDEQIRDEEIRDEEIRDEQIRDEQIRDEEITDGSESRTVQAVSGPGDAIRIGCAVGGSSLVSVIEQNRLPVIQFFLPQTLSPPSIERIRKNLTGRDIRLVVHANYDINLAHPRDSAAGKRSMGNFLREIRFFASILPERMIGFIVVHVGKSMDFGLDGAEENFFRNMVEVLGQTPENVVVLLETAAGQGSEMFTDLRDLVKLYGRILDHGRGIGRDLSRNFRLCLDTCHAFSAGHSVKEMLGILGSPRDGEPSPVALIHMNDSHTPRGSRVDRHANLGQGYIFGEELGGTMDDLRLLINWAVVNDVSIVLETDGRLHQSELDLLYGLAYPDREIRVTITDVQSEMPEINQRIVTILRVLAQASDNRFRREALLKAAEAIKNLDTPVTSGASVKRLPGIGKGIADKVDEIVRTGTLAEYEDQVDELNAVSALTAVSGIGTVTAKKLYNDHGIRTVEQLVEQVRQQKVKLNKAQLGALRHYQDIQTRIPRSEIDKYDEMFAEICRSIDPQLKHVIVGSYRRLKPDSGDIDVLFYHPQLEDAESVKDSPFLKQILRKMGDLVDSVLSHGQNKIMMIAHLPGHPSRRVDFLLSSKESYATSLMYFTGSKEFNILCRNKAIRLGYKLSEQGLFDKDGRQIPTPTERSVFEHLGIEYLPPEAR